MKKIISYLLIITGLLLLAVNTVSARECHTVYGGGEVCENGDISLDKKVWQPKAAQYWDNIAASSYAFAPEEEVIFSLRVKNTSDIRVDKVRLNDDFARLFDYMTYVSSDGDYRGEVTDNQIKFDFGNLEPDEEETVYFKARFKSEGELPVGESCLTNYAVVYSHSDDTEDSDYASFCVNNPNGAIVTEVTPDTGFDLTTLLIMQALALAGLGIFALSKSRKVLK